MEEQSQRKAPPSRVVIGIVIIALGVILLAGNLGWLDARHLLRTLWPLALVAGGIAMIRDPRRSRARPWAWVMITVGIWLFADKIGWVPFNIWDIFVPALLLVVGGTLVVRAVSDKGTACRPRSSESSSESTTDESASEDRAPVQKRLTMNDAQPEFIRSTAFMSYCDLHPVGQPFRGGELNAVMGGIKLDLRDAPMEGDQATLDIFTFWGGIELLVPPDWTVTNKVSTIVGGFFDARRPSKVIQTKTLIVRGYNLMSGVEVKN